MLSRKSMCPEEKNAKLELEKEEEEKEEEEDAFHLRTLPGTCSDSSIGTFVFLAAYFASFYLVLILF